MVLKYVGWCITIYSLSYIWNNNLIMQKKTVFYDVCKKNIKNL